MTARITPAPMRPPRGDGMAPPLGLVGPRPPPLRPNSALMRLLKSRQTSSRSGGPSHLPGRRGGSEPPLPPPRPQPGSLRLKSLEIRPIVSRDSAGLCDCPAQRVQSGALDGADKYPRNRTMRIAVDPRRQARRVNLVVDQYAGDVGRADFRKDLVDLGDLLVALGAGGVDHVQQQ